MIWSSSLFAQQIAISRIDEMPNFPLPYEMRDWSGVAQKYDSLVYNEMLSGEYLPLIEHIDQTVNYPEHKSYGLHSYVGTSSPLSGEAINVLPSVIGATLCGIDKSNQFEENWVLMCEEYFNKASGEDVYLNNPGGQSGHDWWYETMPNVFFYQLNELYPHTGEFDMQFINIADRWLEAIMDMGGNTSPWEVPEMTYRAWNLQLREPLDEGVPEPEAAGAIAWILYNAYIATDKNQYRIGAEWCLEYLNGLESNPSYELQLAYGTYTAVRMNAELGCSYDVEKMLNWCFDIGPLRNWGAIVGTWGGLDCDGLIGEQAAGGTGYGFAMNGFQQAAALMPLVRYDDRYAHTLGKWILNLANASRLYYSNYLPDENQDAKNWTSVYDPMSLIAYEALKETVDGKSPFSTGDAIKGGWAATNLALYGSSHVGMLGGILKKTNIEGILQIDLLKTDYYKKEALPSYLYYNPHTISHEVSIDLGDARYDIYECTTDQFLQYGQTGQSQISIAPDQAMVIVLVPDTMEITNAYKHTLAGEIVIDYQNGISVNNFSPRIKSLASKDSVVIVSSEHLLFCTAEDKDGDALQYSWSGNSGPWFADSTYLWKAPENPGYYTINCFVMDSNGIQDSMDLTLHAVDRIITPPVIESLQSGERKIHPGTSTSIYCNATDINNDPINYSWTASGGNIEGEGASVTWSSPLTEGNYNIFCEVRNLDLLKARDSLVIMVRDSTYSQSGTIVASFPLDGNTNDFSINHNHGIPHNISWESNQFGEAEKAAGFNGSNSSIIVSNRAYLNFSDGLALTCWIKPSEITSREQFIVSHGSWQNRWKLSITNMRLRFTINGSAGIVDLDSDLTIQYNTWQHLAAVYNGKDLELYINGELNSFKSWTGSINTTTSDVTIGQMLPDNSLYNFYGSLDDVRIFNYGINQHMVKQIFTGELTEIINFAKNNLFTIYPNPAQGFVRIRCSNDDCSLDKIWITGVTGNVLWSTNNTGQYQNNSQFILPLGNLDAGLYFLHLLKQRELHTQKLVMK